MNDITALALVTPEMLASLKLSASNLAEGEMMSFEPAVFRALAEALEAAQQNNDGVAGVAEHYETTISMLKGRIAELESCTVTPVNYSESMDADNCRKWAWEQVKNEVTTEGWSTSDSLNYFGFFCWGWDMRRQYNEQRTVTVKLPTELELRCSDVCSECAGNALQVVEDKLRAAGIQVIEGEGQ